MQTKVYNLTRSQMKMQQIHNMNEHSVAMYSVERNKTKLIRTLEARLSQEVFLSPIILRACASFLGCYLTNC
jgi:hypothetical protein